MFLLIVIQSNSIANYYMIFCTSIREMERREKTARSKSTISAAQSFLGVARGGDNPRFMPHEQNARSRFWGQQDDSRHRRHSHSYSNHSRQYSPSPCSMSRHHSSKSHSSRHYSGRQTRRSPSFRNSPSHPSNYRHYSRSRSRSRSQSTYRQSKNVARSSRHRHSLTPRKPSPKKNHHRSSRYPSNPEQDSQSKNSEQMPVAEETTREKNAREGRANMVNCQQEFRNHVNRDPDSEAESYGSLHQSARNAGSIRNDGSITNRSNQSDYVSDGYTIRSNECPTSNKQFGNNGTISFKSDYRYDGDVYGPDGYNTEVAFSSSKEE